MYWIDIIAGICNHNSGDSDAQCKKFKRLIQKVNPKYLGKEAIEEQCDAMELGDLKYDGLNHMNVIERLFEINDNLEFLGEEASKFSMHEMAQRVIPNILKTATSLRFYDKGGKDL